ncbi:hypothetical protein ACHAW5_005620 [Stephanodiscus triporus]|uniref:Bromo domain-containing protein n=1 Tax=Stephanodiscus triporus TaxID=2934178 RepID=A0ABD3PLM5_9STRA
MDLSNDTHVNKVLFPASSSSEEEEEDWRPEAEATSTPCSRGKISSKDKQNVLLVANAKDKQLKQLQQEKDETIRRLKKSEQEFLVASEEANAKGRQLKKLRQEKDETIRRLSKEANAKDKQLKKLQQEKDETIQRLKKAEEEILVASKETAKQIAELKMEVAAQTDQQDASVQACDEDFRKAIAPQDLAFCREIHAGMTSKKLNDINYLFLEPVNYALYSDYLDIVEYPMDLRTLKENLEGGRYSTRDEFYSDAKMIFDNAVLFNKGRDSAWVVNLAKRMTKALERLRKKAERNAAARECADQCKSVVSNAHHRKLQNSSECDANIENRQLRGDLSKAMKDDADAEKAMLRGLLSEAIVIKKLNVKWDDVAGLVEAKESLKETVIIPKRFPHLFTGKREPFKGILLYGPPGTGKSYLAKAVATEANSPFFSISSSNLISKWQGESERLVRNLFEMARESPGSRAIIFIDEIDSLCGSRSEGECDSARRVKTEFLVQMDGVGKKEGDVLVLGATNVPWELDAAIRRRFEKRVYIPLPEHEARSAMVKIHLGDTPNNLCENDFDTLGQQTEGASGSDIKVLVKEVLMEPIRHCKQAQQFMPVGKFLVPCVDYPNCPSCPLKLLSDPPNKNHDCKKCGAKRMTLWDVPSEKIKAPDVTVKDFMRQLGRFRPSVSEKEMEEHPKWTKQFGQDGA